MVQIGTEGGYLAAEVFHPNDLFFNPLTLTGNMLLGCAERSDFIIDFTGQAGKEFVLYNDAPGPFPGGPPTTDFWLGNPLNPVQPQAGTGPDTRQLLKIRVNKPLACTRTAPAQACSTQVTRRNHSYGSRSTGGDYNRGAGAGWFYPAAVSSCGRPL